MSLAAQRVGGSATQVITVSNTAATGGYSEALNASIGGTSGAATGSGSISLLAAGGSNSSAISVGVNTTTAGAKSGTVTLAYVSDGTGTSGLGQTNLSGQTLNVSGNVYQAASAATVAPVNFGIVHVGDTATRNVTVTNSAATVALNDTLQAAMAGSGGGFTASGGFSGLGAQSSNSTGLSVALNTATAGARNGSASVSFSSHNAEMADLDLGSQTVGFSAQVNNYAQAGLSKTSGAGSFSGSGSVYTLDLGRLQWGASAQGILDLGNIGGIAGFTDWMNGSFNLSGAGDFNFTNFGAFSALAGGADLAGLGVSLDGHHTGTFDEFITLSWTGGNGSGYQGDVQQLTLELKGSVAAAVPEPATWVLLLAGAGLIGRRAARQRQARSL